jgi:hypothetical protein
MRGEIMRTIDRRLRKLEEESKRRSIKHLLLVERYPGQPLEEAKAEADLSSMNESDYQIVFMTAQDAAIL